MSSSVETVVYVSREIERALGATPNESYRIVSNRTAFGERVRQQHPDFVSLVEAPLRALLGTTELLNHESTLKFVAAAGAGASILVFKNTARVEAAAKNLKCRLLNPPALLSERIENKLSQIRWLGPMAHTYLPPHAIKVSKYITWKGTEPFVIQWAHGHTGDGTTIVRTPDDLRAIHEKFPERMARVTSYVDGPSFTVNAVVTNDRVMVGSVSYQITGREPFTDNPFATVGNDWHLAQTLLSATDRSTIEAMATAIGDKMRVDGWRGLFGIDVIRDAKGRIYLIEVNARQPASTTFESSLEEKARNNGVKGLTLFEAHIRALLNLPIDQELVKIVDGAQIIQRVTKGVQNVFDDISGTLELSGYSVVAYQNTEPNADLLRVQSTTGIMADHNVFNDHGKEVAETIKNSHFKIEI